MGLNMTRMVAVILAAIVTLMIVGAIGYLMPAH